MTPGTSPCFGPVDGGTVFGSCVVGLSVAVGAVTVVWGFGVANGAVDPIGVADGTSLCDGVFENSAFETIAALAATPTTSALLPRLATLISWPHILVSHPFTYAIGFLTDTTRPSRESLMGQRYYLRMVRVIDGMTVVGAIAGLVALPPKIAPVGLVQ